mgnify:CR=1 FL=1
MKKIECVTMRIPGRLKVNPLPAILLGTTLALFILLPVFPPTVNTLEGNTFGPLEPLKERSVR